MRKIDANSKPRIALPASAILTLLCVAQFLDAMDISSMGIIAPIIQHDLGMSPQSLQWIVSGYALGFGGFLLLGGRAADLFGRRRIFLVSMLLFTVASIVGGLAPNDTVLVAARIAKGIFAGFTAPAALSLLLAQFTEPAARSRAIGVFSASSAMGFALGMAIGGILGDLSWRLVFLLPVPFALGVTVLVALSITPDEVKRIKKKFDLLSSIMGTSALLLIVLGTTLAATHGWSSSAALTPMLGGAIVLASFLAYQKRSKSPLLPLDIFDRPGLKSAGAIAFIMQGTYTGLQFVMALYLQSVLGWSALQSSLSFAVSGLIMAVLAAKLAALATRFGSMALILGGLIVQTIGYVWLLLLGQVPEVLLLAVMSVLFGVGIAATYPAVNILGLAQTKEAEHGLASSILLSLFSIGGGIVLSVAASVYAASATGGLTRFVNTLFLLFGLSSLITLAAGVLWGRARRQNQRSLPS